MITIVVPIMNEEESLNPLVEELKKELLLLKQVYEIIFIDDGSTDNSLPVLKDIEKKNKNISVFSFRKNQGKAEALTLGFQKAKGEYVITMDGDLEDKPSELSKFIEKANEGWDVVSGWRKNRKHSSPRIISSRISNYFIRLLWGLELHDYNCGFKLFTQEAAKAQKLYGGLYRFMSLIAYQQGFKVTEVVVPHQNRKYGKSKFGFFKLWKDLPDAFTMLFLDKYGERPLHFFGIIGGLLLLLGSGILLGLFVYQLMGHSIGRRPLLIFGMLLFISGLQIFFTGFIAELIISGNNRVYKHPPLRYESNKI